MIVDDLKELIQKYSWRVQVRTQELIQDINHIVFKYEQETKSSLIDEIQPVTDNEHWPRLGDVQALYIKKYWKLPNRYKNNIEYLSSKL